MRVCRRSWRARGFKTLSSTVRTAWGLPPLLPPSVHAPPAALTLSLSQQFSARSGCTRSQTCLLSFRHSRVIPSSSSSLCSRADCSHTTSTATMRCCEYWAEKTACRAGVGAYDVLRISCRPPDEDRHAAFRFAARMSLFSAAVTVSLFLYVLVLPLLQGAQPNVSPMSLTM